MCKLKNPEKTAAQMIFKKKVIGWVQGRSELDLGLEIDQ